MIDKKYCMSAYLMFRGLLDENNKFFENSKTRVAYRDFYRIPIHDSEELYNHLKKEIESASSDGKAALMLSGGIDSTILANFMPKGSKTYTFKCVVPDVVVTDETPIAKANATRNSLDNEVVEIYWEDFDKYAPTLMKHKGAPIHSIEVQIYKAALKAKEDVNRPGFIGDSFT